MTYTLDNMIHELKGLNGKEVTVFGQSQVVNDDITDTDLIIDTTEILRNFRERELIYDEVELYDFETDTEETLTFDNTDEYINYMLDIGELEELESSNFLSAGNTYNWSAKVTHHLNWFGYKNVNTGNYIIELKSHLYGDVRGNYTDNILLEFYDDYDFLEGLSVHESREFEIDDVNYTVDFNSTSEELIVYNSDNFDEEIGYFYSYDIDELKDDVKNYIK